MLTAAVGSPDVTQMGNMLIITLTYTDLSPCSYEAGTLMKTHGASASAFQHPINSSTLSQIGVMVMVVSYTLDHDVVSLSRKCDI